MELEIKLVACPGEPLDPEAVLAGFGEWGGTLGPSRTQLLDASYHDRDDGLLRRARWVLRCRAEANGPVATVKGPGPLVDGIRGRVEIEVPLDQTAEPGDPLPPRLATALADAGLPLDRWPPRTFRSIVTRVAADLALPDGTVAELAIDHGDVQAAGGRSEVRELELELVEGDPARLIDAVLRAAARFEVRPGVRTKAGRGQLLLGLLPTVTPPAADASPPRRWEVLAELEERRLEGLPWQAEEHLRLALGLGIQDRPEAPGWNRALWDAFARAARA